MNDLELALDELQDGLDGEKGNKLQPAASEIARAANELGKQYLSRSSFSPSSSSPPPPPPPRFLFLHSGMEWLIETDFY